MIQILQCTSLCTFRVDVLSDTEISCNIVLKESRGFPWGVLIKFSMHDKTMNLPSLVITKPANILFPALKE